MDSTISSQQMGLTAALLKDNDNDNIYTNMFITMLLSSIVMTVIQNLSVSSFINYVFSYITDFMEKYNFSKKEYKIILSSRRFYNKFGASSNDITENKLAILHFIKKNMNSFNDLYKIEEDYVRKGSGYYEDENFKKEDYYTIAQNTEIFIENDNKYYLKIKSIDTAIDDNNDFGIKKEKNKDSRVMKVNDLVISSNKSLLHIKNFIEKCLKVKKEDDSNDTRQYIYTYIGEDENKKLVYDKELFLPYANFNGLVGDNIKKIEKNFDFFISEEGKKWYSDRCLPYQLSHLYYGEPGTGKSIIASAIANKYNLHIVKIKLSELKSNAEFSRVFRNRNFNETKIDYCKILYLFDEIDLDLEKLIQKNKSADKKQISLHNNENNNKDNNILYINNVIDINLSLGTILEEINGINQMYGRKMVFITNNFQNLENIHNGALIRPGRIDLKLKMEKCLVEDMLKLINIFFPNDNLSLEDLKKLTNYKYSAAELSNLLRMNSFENLIKII